jgi:hypothetical protein
MRIVVEKLKFRSAFRVKAIQGNQSFYLGYDSPATREECEWMAKMFRRALRDHVREKRK